ncbi:hypothetical protein L7F22_051955 [Adiantum nelumboides]|nr:hypothetical protein [Adiantum nelumboides]
MPEGTVEVELVKAHGLKDVESFGKSDPYATVTIGTQKQQSRTVHDGGENPVWNQSFLIEIPDGPQELDITVFDQERRGMDEKMGTVSIHLSELFVKRHIPPCKYKVQRPDGKFHGELEVGLKFFPKVHHGALEVHLLEAHGLLDTDAFGKSDPYAIIYCQKELQKSIVINGTSDPVWNQKFVFNVNSEVTEIFIKLFDKDDVVADDALGSVLVPLSKVFTQGHIPPTRYKVMGSKGQPQGEVSLALKFTPRG